MLKNAIVLGTVLVLISLFACGAPECPAELSAGASCSEEGQVCHYDVGCIRPQPYACSSGEWKYDGPPDNCVERPPSPRPQVESRDAAADGDASDPEDAADAG